MSVLDEHLLSREYAEMEFAEWLEFCVRVAYVTAYWPPDHPQPKAKPTEPVVPEPPESTLLERLHYVLEKVLKLVGWEMIVV